MTSMGRRSWVVLTAGRELGWWVEKWVVGGEGWVVGGG
jgi:hypothetical protein